MTTLAAILVVLGGACFLVRVITGPSLADRVVALDGLVVSIVTVILLVSIMRDSDAYLDAALVVAFVGFLSTTAAARFIERRGG